MRRISDKGPRQNAPAAIPLNDKQPGPGSGGCRALETAGCFNVEGIPGGLERSLIPATSCRTGCRICSGMNGRGALGESIRLVQRISGESIQQDMRERALSDSPVLAPGWNIGIGFRTRTSEKIPVRRNHQVNPGHQNLILLIAGYHPAMTRASPCLCIPFHGKHDRCPGCAATWGRAR